MRFPGIQCSVTPVLLNLSHGGGSWKEHGISHARVMERVSPEIEAGCRALWHFLQEKLVEARENGFFGEDPPQTPIS